MYVALYGSTALTAGAHWWGNIEDPICYSMAHFQNLVDGGDDLMLNGDLILCHLRGNVLLSLTHHCHHRAVSVCVSARVCVSVCVCVLKH